MYISLNQIILITEKRCTLLVNEFLACILIFNHDLPPLPMFLYSQLTKGGSDGILGL